MGFLDDIFDLNGDGKVSIDEEFLAFQAFSSLCAEPGAADEGEVDGEDGDVDALAKAEDEAEDEEPIVLPPRALKAEAYEIDLDLEDLRNKLSELEYEEPDSVLSAKYDRWEEKCDALREAISNMESDIQDRIDSIQEELDDLEFDEPDDLTSRAHDRWEARCESLQEQIDDLEALLW